MEDKLEIKKIKEVLLKMTKKIIEMDRKLDILKEEIERIKYDEWQKYCNEWSGPPPDNLW